MTAFEELVKLIKIPSPRRETAGGSDFDAPWQAQTVALTVALEACGVLVWNDWARKFRACLEHDAVQAASQPADRYFQCWLDALEASVLHQGLSDAPTLARFATGWQVAAHRTPHGTPIVLRPEDLPGASRQ